MSLALKFSVLPSANALSFYFRDDTGVYNSISNITGYGSPNIAIADILYASFTIILADGTTKTFTTADGFYPLFPNTTGVLFQVLNTALGLSATTAISDWISQATYSVSVNADGSNPVSTTKYVFISSQSICCVNNLLAEAGFDGNCLCENADLENWVRGLGLLKSIQAALDCAPQLPNKASVNLTGLTELCNQSGCGCNCN